MSEDISELISEPEDVSKDIPVLGILGGRGDEPLFNDETRYVIPLYQRPYAWEEEQIEQLIEDIESFDQDLDFDQDHNRSYYLGSLVVHKRDSNEFEVIDGQQRLTTLFLLLNAMGRLNLSPDAIPLSFDCRQRSNETLRHLDNLENLDSEKIEATIERGLKIIKSRLCEIEDLDSFGRKLQDVILYRIEVPPTTDLNHYFEIMNTRGEQLEAHEVLKASLMEPLRKNAIDQDRFSIIWDACSDMSGYVQMHFSTSVRKQLFGGNWDDCPKPENINSSDTGRLRTNEAYSILDAIKAERKNDTALLDADSEESRFKSIIDFPLFLLHVLKVLVRREGIVDSDGNEPLDELLDDRKLNKAFDRVISEGLVNGRPINPKRFSKRFIIYLLRCRYLFDRYIVKREDSGESPDGEWSLKCLNKANERESAYYANTRLLPKEHENNMQERNKRVLMIQACMRVSYTSPRVMHWITKSLEWLYEHGGSSLDSGFEEMIEGQAKTAVAPFVRNEDMQHAGVNTPHIVFNYLDYLLWKQNKEFDDFKFEFRTSVEHWYPQNPSDGTFDSWDNKDYFGNLCIVHRLTNSKFSNLAPCAKASTFKDMIDKGSPKLRLMRDNTHSEEDWRNKECEKHGEEMLKLLKEACSGTVYNG